MTAFCQRAPIGRSGRTIAGRCGFVAAQRIRRSPGAAFTLIEILLALALVALLLVGLNTFIFSMGELWGQRADVRLFDQHVRAVTRFLEHELRAAALPPA